MNPLHDKDLILLVGEYLESQSLSCLARVGTDQLAWLTPVLKRHKKDVLGVNQVGAEIIDEIEDYGRHHEIYLAFADESTFQDKLLTDLIEKPIKCGWGFKHFDYTQSARLQQLVDEWDEECSLDNWAPEYGLDEEGKKIRIILDRLFSLPHVVCVRKLEEIPWKQTSRKMGGSGTIFQWRDYRIEIFIETGSKCMVPDCTGLYMTVTNENS